MRGNDGRRVYYRITQAFRPFPLSLRNPDGRQMERRLKSRDTRNLFLHIPGIHGHIMVEQNLSLAHLNSLYLDNILIGIQLNIVAQTDNGNHRTKLQRNLTPNHNHTVQQVAALVHVSQRDNAVTELQLDGIHLEKARHIFRLPDCIRRLFIPVHFALNGSRLQIAGNHPAANDKQKPHSHKENRIQIRKNSQKNQCATYQIHYLRNTEKLSDNGRTEIGFLASLGNQYTC